jgi:hypothetical protein
MAKMPRARKSKNNVIPTVVFAHHAEEIVFRAGDDRAKYLS